MKNAILLLLSWFVFSGCETPPSPASQPPKKLGPDAATIYLLRTPGPGVLITGIIKVDGFEVGRMKHSTYGVILVTPGKHTIKYEKPGWTLEAGDSAAVECQPGQTYYLVYGAHMEMTGFAATPGGASFANRGNILRLPEAEGKATMAKLSYAFTYGEKTEAP